MVELLDQGGYAFFVWSSYGMALVLLIVELAQLRNRHRTILTRLGRRMRAGKAPAKTQAGRGA